MNDNAGTWKVLSEDEYKQLLAENAALRIPLEEFVKDDKPEETISFWKSVFRGTLAKGGANGILDTNRELQAELAAANARITRLEAENATLREALGWAANDNPRDLEINRSLPIEEQLRVWRMYLENSVVLRERAGARNATRSILQYNPEEKVSQLRDEMKKFAELVRVAKTVITTYRTYGPEIARDDVKRMETVLKALEQAQGEKPDA